MFRFVSVLVLYLSFVVCALMGGGCMPELVVPSSVEELHKLARERVGTLLDEASWWREGDGYAYAVDVGHLMIYAAVQKEKALYDSLRTFAQSHLVLNDPKDDYTRGFVLWRYKPGVDGDASGTTEALRIAEGFWRGHQSFGEAEDKQMALMILNGYARHAFVDQGIWLIRNYFNLGTRAFVTNSFLVDYDPDFVDEVAKETQDKTLQEVAEKSYEIVRKAGSKAGLLYSIIQPEVGTLLPLELSFFSPNDVIKLLNCSSVAERVTRGERGSARRVLDFVLAQGDELTTYFLGRTGEKVELGVSSEPGPSTYASLLRLAIKLEDNNAINALLPPFIKTVQTFVRTPSAPKLYVYGEILLAFSALSQYRQ